MTKLFNVVADLDTMTSDQMKGAIRNMESTGNLLHAAYQAAIADVAEKYTVLSLNWDDIDKEIHSLYVPALDGGTEIVTRVNSTSLLFWQLEFFSKYGNLILDFEILDGPYMHCLVSNDNFAADTEDGWLQWVTAQKEKERSDAGIYESMSKKTKF